MVNSMFIQPQAVNQRDASKGYVAKFDNLQEAMGYLKAVDTVETAVALDPLVQLASFGPLDSAQGAVLGQISADALHAQGFNSSVNGSNAHGTEWTLNGPAGMVSFHDGPNGMAATVADASGFRQVAISSQGNGILYQEFT